MANIKLGKLFHSDILCPYCMNELNRTQILYMCPTCGKEIKQNAFEFARMKAPVCNDPNCQRQITKRYCIQCRTPLPFDILQYKKNLRFALIGITGSGKTNYLTTMITEAKKTDDFPMIFTWRENQTRIVYLYNKNMLYKDKDRLDETDPGVRPKAQQWKLTPRNGGTTGKLQDNGKNTDIYSLTLFDGAGEDCEHTDPVISRYINGAHALIVLYDPLALPNLSMNLSEKAIQRSTTAHHVSDDNAAMVEEISNYIRENCRINAGKKIPKDVAIVFTKIDEVLDTFGFGTVRKPSPHLEAGGFVQEDADEVDREIRNWLKEWGEISFLDAIEANFDSSHVRFFGVSSFGSHPDDNGHPIDVKPHRVLDPLYWMLSLEGVIPIISNETEKEQDESSFEE